MPDVNLTSPSLHTPIGVGGKEGEEEGGGEGEEEGGGEGKGGEGRGEGGGEEERDDTSRCTRINYHYFVIINMATIICSLNKFVIFKQKIITNLRYGLLHCKT